MCTLLLSDNSYLIVCQRCSLCTYISRVPEQPVWVVFYDDYLVQSFENVVVFGNAVHFRWTNLRVVGLWIAIKTSFWTRRVDARVSVLHMNRRTRLRLWATLLGTCWSWRRLWNISRLARPAAKATLSNWKEKHLWKTQKMKTATVGQWQAPLARRQIYRTAILAAVRYWQVVQMKCQTVMLH